MNGDIEKIQRYRRKPPHLGCMSSGQNLAKNSGRSRGRGSSAISLSNTPNNSVPGTLGDGTSGTNHGAGPAPVYTAWLPFAHRKEKKKNGANKPNVRQKARSFVLCGPRHIKHESRERQRPQRDMSAVCHNPGPRTLGHRPRFMDTG